MQNSDRKRFVNALMACAEMYGKSLSDSLVGLYWEGLADCDIAAVERAIARHMNNPDHGQYMPKLADIRRYMPSRSLRPKPDEAWASALLARDEAETVVWTEEAASAFAVASPLLKLGDKTGARMAFRDAYERQCEQAEQSGAPTKWQVSLGWDADKRRLAIESATTAGYLTNEYAQKLMPPAVDQEKGRAMLALAASHGVLTDDGAQEHDREQAKMRIGQIKAMLTGSDK